MLPSHAEMIYYLPISGNMDLFPKEKKFPGRKENTTYELCGTYIARRRMYLGNRTEFIFE